MFSEKRRWTVPVSRKLVCAFWGCEQSNVVALVFLGQPLIQQQVFKQQLKTFWFCYKNTHTRNRFMAPFPGPPGWAGARRELLDFMVQGEINRGRHSDHPAGRHSIRTNQCPPPPSPIFFMGQMPFLPPNQQCQSTEGNKRIRIREKMLEFSSTVLPAPPPYLLL